MYTILLSKMKNIINSNTLFYCSRLFFNVFISNPNITLLYIVKNNVLIIYKKKNNYKIMKQFYPVVVVVGGGGQRLDCQGQTDKSTDLLISIT